MHDWLDAYFDGQLTEAQRARFEAALDDDATLRGAVEQQRAIDASLARMFAGVGEAPPTLSLNGPTDVLKLTEAPTVATARHARRWVGLAATVGILIGAWLIVSSLLPSSNGYDPGVARTPTGLYDHLVASGFTAQWRCDDEAEFMQSFQDRFGQPLRLDESETGIEALGLCYAHVFSASTMCVLSRVDGEPVLVIVDRRERQPPTPPQVRDGLHLFTALRGQLVLFELTPHKTARVLPLLHGPDPETGLPQG